MDWKFASQIGSDILGGYLGKSGQDKANRWNASISNAQMAFQERMSNTQYQRATKDLEKAGLNRIIALGNPATTPSGAGAVMQNPYQSAGNTASAIAERVMQSQQMKLLKEQTKKTQSDTFLNNQLGNKAKMEAAQAEVLKGVYEAIGPTANEFFKAIPGWIQNAKQSADFLTTDNYMQGLNIITKKLEQIMESGKSSAKEVKQDIVDWYDEMKRLDRLKRGH